MICLTSLIKQDWEVGGFIIVTFPVKFGLDVIGTSFFFSLQHLVLILNAV